MNAPISSGYAQLLADALEEVLTHLEQASRVHAHICDHIHAITGAKVTAVLDRTLEGHTYPVAIHPERERNLFESLPTAPFLDMAVDHPTVAFWSERTATPTITNGLASVGHSNALVVPIHAGSLRLGSILALDLPVDKDPEVLVQAMRPLARVLGLMIQNSRLHLEPSSTQAKPEDTDQESRFRAVFDSVNDAILIHEISTGAILDVNLRMCHMFGLSYEEALWMDMGSLSVGLAPCTQDNALEWMRKAAEEGPQTFEWIAKHRSGRLFWIEVDLQRATIGGQDRLLSTARDITERKRTESEQASRLKRSEAQNAVFLALAGVGLNYETALELIAHHLAVQVGDLCILNILDEADGLLKPMALDQPYIDGRPLLPAIKGLSPISLDTPGEGEVARRGDTIQVADPSGEQIKPLIRPELHAYLDHFRVHGLLIVPMRSQEKVIGTITLARCSSSRPYSAEDLAMLQNLADRSALTLVNARLYSENLHQAELLRLANTELEQRVQERTSELAQANETLHRMAIEDALTGLANRRRFNEIMEEEVRRARRNGSGLSLLMCDVDFFKRYNDEYGHQGGDDCLRMVGEIMRQVFKRAGDLPARYGGEEFAVILPGATQENAMCVAEILRKTIEDRAMPHARSEVAPCVTLSIGLAASNELGTDQGPEWFIGQADEALYKSKNAGRNRVTSA